MSRERAFTIFGGTGDLTFRKLLPALYNMEILDHEQSKGQIVIIGRRAYTSEAYQELAEPWVEQFARMDFEEKVYKKMAERIVYYQMDFTDVNAYEGLDEFYREIGVKEHIFYFAVAPRFFGTIVSGLQKVEGAEKGKVVLEKPFGETLQGAEELNVKMGAFFGHQRIYRIDHYLGKEMVRNISTIRFANPIFSNIWDARHIACIQISALEEVGVETRGGYYDHSGALQDMMQNHLLQILTIVAMEQPLGSQAEEMQKEQMKVLEALKLPDDISAGMVLGQYEGYREEDAVAPESSTETYAAVRILIDNDRWRGMPFYVRTGKKLGKREMQVSIVFKSPAPEIQSNILNVKIQPTEGVYLQFNIKKPGESEDIVETRMDFCQSCSLENQMNTPEAYERLLGACMRSERAWFSRWKQIKTSWNYVENIRNLYHKKKLPVYSYEQGSRGPKEADEMLGEFGHVWFE